MNRKIKKGFTLVELLMVLAVVGLLASILIPTAGVFEKKRFENNLQGPIVSIQSAIVQFKSQYGYYPFAREVRTM